MRKGDKNRRNFSALQGMRRFFPWMMWIGILCFSSGCGKTVADENPAAVCNVILEEGEGFVAEQDICTVKRGADASFLITLEEGYQIVEADYADYSLEYIGTGNVRKLTVHQVKYPVVVSLVTKKSDCSIRYYANGGSRLDGGDAKQPVAVPVIKSHLRVNTSIGTNLFAREGYTQIGWNTKADGSGDFIGLGSRVAYTQGLQLYAVWSAWTAESDFSYEISGNCVVITGYHGMASVVSIPGEIAGYPVIAIEEYAFEGADCETLILPDTMQRVANEACKGSAVREVYLYDNISYISDSSFADCKNLRTLHISAIEAPVYSGTYYDTFQDKYDRLLAVSDREKLILFSGSSTRFGYDSKRLAEEFTEYEIVNMGVFAYTNALPQFLLIEKWVGEGDILVHAPEFDARQRQFCTTNALDDKFFCMMESNYDAVAELDLRELSQVFTSFYTYLTIKSDMDAKSYEISPSSFDEDGAPVKEASYNEYGDYIVYRENADSVKPVYGLLVEYTVESFPRENYFEKANAVYQRFLDRGVHVYLTYAPRNQYAISQESTKEARACLHAYLKQELAIPVISDIEESLYPGTYLNGTDNHLSTEGVAIRTERMIKDLHAQMRVEGLEE